MPRRSRRAAAPPAPVIVQQIGAVIRKLKSAGFTVLLVEHDMHIVRQIANRVTVLHQGQKLAEGPLTEVMNNEMVRQVYLGKGKYQ